MKQTNTRAMVETGFVILLLLLLAYLNWASCNLALNRGSGVFG